MRPQTCARWRDFAADANRFGIAVAPLEQGFALTEPALTVLTERELYGERAQQARRRKRARRDPEAVLRDLSELVPGCADRAHRPRRRPLPGPAQARRRRRVDGIPRHRIRQGRQALRAGGPAASGLALLRRRAGAGAAACARRRRLGAREAQGRRRRCATSPPSCWRSTHNARRARAPRSRSTARWPSSSPRRSRSRRRRTSSSAIEAVITDLAAQRPMDRVVCGDVGFGKTEVALRAAFVAATAGKQVAVLAPTTLLAQQHYQNFRDRYADWPIKVEVLSRFKSKKEDLRRAGEAGGRPDRRDDRHAPAGAAGREVQGSGPGHHRRGAAFRRAPEGGAEEAARRGRPADADRDADPAHPEHGDGRAARPVDHRHAAGAPPGRARPSSAGTIRR